MEDGREIRRKERGRECRDEGNRKREGEKKNKGKEKFTKSPLGAIALLTVVLR